MRWPTATGLAEPWCTSKSWSNSSTRTKDLSHISKTKTTSAFMLKISQAAISSSLRQKRLFRIRLISRSSSSTMRKYSSSKTQRNQLKRGNISARIKVKIKTKARNQIARPPQAHHQALHLALHPQLYLLLERLLARKEKYDSFKAINFNNLNAIF